VTVTLVSEQAPEQHSAGDVRSKPLPRQSYQVPRTAAEALNRLLSGEGTPWRKGEKGRDIWTAHEVALLKFLLHVIVCLGSPVIKGLTIAKLAAVCRMSTRTVHRALAVLCDKAGVVVRHGGRHGAKEINAYEIELERLASWEGQKRPKSWSMTERSVCDRIHEDRAIALAESRGIPLSDPDVARAIAGARQLDRVCDSARRAEEATEKRAARLESVAGRVESLLAGIEARHAVAPSPASAEPTDASTVAVSDAAPTSESAASGERPLLATPKPTSAPSGPASLSVPELEKALEKKIAQEPNEALLPVLLRGLREENPWSIGVTEYLLLSPKGLRFGLSPEHKRVLTSRATAYAKKDAEPSRGRRIGIKQEQPEGGAAYEHSEF